MLRLGSATSHGAMVLDTVDRLASDSVWDRTRRLLIPAPGVGRPGPVKKKISQSSTSSDSPIVKVDIGIPTKNGKMFYFCIDEVTMNCCRTRQVCARMTPSSVKSFSARTEVRRTRRALIAATGTVPLSFSSPASALPLGSATYGGSPTSATGTAEVSCQQKYHHHENLPFRGFPHPLCHLPGADGPPRVPVRDGGRTVQR